VVHEQAVAAPEQHEDDETSVRYLDSRSA
jgi:hypothetical protein